MPDPAAPSSPCPTCGLPVVWGQVDNGDLCYLVAVEPQTLTYVMVWDRGAQWPRLCQSRGYPVHTCHPTPEGRG